jgi:adenosylcobinamide kinase/adenosylcobinamide-phosphate guanylyltransferase
MSKSLTLILGGARSGKSALALKMAEAGRRVLFVATAQPGDAEMAERIAAHRASRPPGWDTLEAPLELPDALADRGRAYDTVAVDCLTLWVTNLLLEGHRNKGQGSRDPEQEARRLLEVYEKGTATWIVVSNEVGLGVVPPSPLGRQFQDSLGRVNQLVAERADRVYFVVAGLSLELKRLGARGNLT